MASEAVTANETSRVYFQFSGQARDYFRIWIVNVLLTVLTLGVYSAWAKVRRRRYVYGHTRLQEGRFDYHANPVAILRGRLIAVALLLLVLAVRAFAPAFMPVIGTLIAVFIPWVIVRSRMFSMRNTSFRGVRFGFIPAYWEAFQMVFFAGLLAVGTFGIGAPVAHFLRNRFVISHTYYGNLRFNMKPVIWDFFWAYLMAFVASSIIIFPLFNFAFNVLASLQLTTGSYSQLVEWVPRIILALAAYLIIAQFVSAATLSPTLKASSIGSADEGESPCTLGCDWSLNRLLMLYLINFIAIICSFGLLLPWAQMRVTRYLVNGTWIEHSDVLHTVAGRPVADMSSVGEEVGSVFDVDIGL